MFSLSRYMCEGHPPNGVAWPHLDKGRRALVRGPRCDRGLEVVPRPGVAQRVRRHDYGRGIAPEQRLFQGTEQHALCGSAWSTFTSARDVCLVVRCAAARGRCLRQTGMCALWCVPRTSCEPQPLWPRERLPTVRHGPTQVGMVMVFPDVPGIDVWHANLERLVRAHNRVFRITWNAGAPSWL